MVSLGSVRGRGGGDFGFDDGFTILVLNPAAFARMNLPGGMTYSWAKRLGRKIEQVAEFDLYPFHGYRTGQLQRSIGSSVTPGGDSVFLNVRASSRHAIYYHEGTRAHRIEPNGGALVFYGERDGKKLVFKRGRGVNWGSGTSGGTPGGFRGNPFLRNAMVDVLFAEGISR